MKPTAAAARKAQRAAATARAPPAQRGWLGIAFSATRQHAGDATTWVVVERVMPGAPAARSGVQPGDTVLNWNGRADVIRELEGSRVRPGDKVRLRLRRSGGEREVGIVAGTRPAGLPEIGPGGPRELAVFGPGEERRLRQRLDSLRMRLDSGALHADSLFHRLRVQLGDRAVRLRGLERLERPRGPGPVMLDVEIGHRAVGGAEFIELNPGLAGYFGTERGALVLRVAPETPASGAGLQAGDVVTRVDGQLVGSVSDLRQAVVRARGKAVQMEVLRKGEPVRLQMRWQE